MVAVEELDELAERFALLCGLFEAFAAGVFDVEEALAYRVTSPQARAFAMEVLRLLEHGP